MNRNFITILTLLTIFLSACSGTRIATMRKSKMEQLELGMSQSQVVTILGSSYSISQKEVSNKDTIELISYRNIPFDDETVQALEDSILYCMPIDQLDNLLH